MGDAEWEAVADRHLRSPDRSRIVLALGLALLHQEAPGQPTAQSMERVVVTGSHIPRIDLEAALPLSVITREDIERSGTTTVEQLLARVPANYNGAVLADSVGNTNDPGLSSANLRGLGNGTTLVLLNGRRVANYAFNGAAIDLNMIPLAAVERVEILKDGASAIYGSDAIAGVINFVLRDDFRGISVAAEGSSAQHAGGNGALLSAAFGTGALAADGYNVFALFTHQREQAVRAIDRDFTSPSHRLDGGYGAFNGHTYPASIVDRPRRRILNPAFAAGCSPPATVPALVPPFYTNACTYDTRFGTDLLPDIERTGALLRATRRVSATAEVVAEAMASRSVTDARTAAAMVPIASSSFGQPFYPAGGPWYPTAFAQANGLSGDLLIAFRPPGPGPRTNETTADAQRYLVGIRGAMDGWDYDVAASYSANQQDNAYGGSWLYLGRAVQAVGTGLINPWGPSGPDGDALLASLVYRGTPQSADGSTTLLNGFASREIARLPAGALALSVGGEARTERLSYDWDEAVLSGESPIENQRSSISGRRHVGAIFGELHIPILASLSAQLAMRFDDYSDFGSTTNPKAALRWTPWSLLLVRASWGTGFRAPGLYSLAAPTARVGVVPGVRDPVRCPVTGAVDDCVAIVQNVGGGNPDLQPETSRQWNVGLVVQASRGLSLGIDYWNIEQRDVIGAVDPHDIVKYYDRYANRVSRGPVDPAYPGLPGPIVSIDSSLANLGTTQTAGFDFTADWSPAVLDAVGRLRIRLAATYVREWDTSVDGETFSSRLADATAGPPAPRWRSTLVADWTSGPWTATLANTYSSGYRDSFLAADGARVPFDVPGFGSWDVQAAYGGLIRWRLTAGVRNLLDSAPPFSAASTMGYNPRFANPVGRALYLRAVYTI